MANSGPIGFEQNEAPFKSLGEKLRSLREAQNLSYEDVAEATHVRPFVLQAIEEGRIEDLPSIVYARGFIKTYCEFLCAPDIWNKFEPYLKSPVELCETINGRHEDLGNIASPRPMFRRSSMVWVYLVLLIAVGGAGFLMWQQQHGGGGSFFPSFRTPADDADAAPATSSDVAASRDISDISKDYAALLASGDIPPVTFPAVSSDDKMPVSDEVAVAAAEKNSILTIEGRGKSNCWVGIYARGKLVYRATLKSGDVKSYDVTEDMYVRFGNGGAAKVAWSGEVYDPIGKAGVPASYYFTADGEMGQGKKKPAAADTQTRPQRDAGVRDRPAGGVSQTATDSL